MDLLSEWQGLAHSSYLGPVQIDFTYTIKLYHRFVRISLECFLDSAFQYNYNILFIDIISDLNLNNILTKFIFVGIPNYALPIDYAEGRLFLFKVK